MSTKSAQHPTQAPLQARHKVIVVTAIILLVAAVAWIMAYTRAVGTAPIAGKAPVISPTETAH